MRSYLYLKKNIYIPICIYYYLADEQSYVYLKKNERKELMIIHTNHKYFKVSQLLEEKKRREKNYI